MKTTNTVLTFSMLCLIFVSNWLCNFTTVFICGCRREAAVSREHVLMCNFLQLSPIMFHTCKKLVIQLSLIERTWIPLDTYNKETMLSRRSRIRKAIIIIASL